MDFKIVATIILILLSLILVNTLNSKFSKKDLSIYDIITSASEGKTNSIIMSMEATFNICEQVNAEYGCEGVELGAEGDCELQKNTPYLITASPSESGVCLNITKI